MDFVEIFPNFIEITMKFIENTDEIYRKITDN